MWAPRVSGWVVGGGSVEVGPCVRTAVQRSPSAQLRYYSSGERPWQQQQQEEEDKIKGGQLPSFLLQDLEMREVGRRRITTSNSSSSQTTFDFDFAISNQSAPF
uniref:Uncharacterized protein n=1 Tax=Oryza nivara TaxID=4536 RepID=A0A0E0G2A5_ORYNI